LRLNLISLIDDITIKSHKDFLPVIPDLCSMLSKILIDQCPEVKNKISESIIKLTNVLGNKMGVHSKLICNSLCLNLKHSHNKIRKITLQVFFIFYLFYLRLYVKYFYVKILVKISKNVIHY
jgi:hypothetical protein